MRLSRVISQRRIGISDRLLNRGFHPWLVIESASDVGRRPPQQLLDRDLFVTGVFSGSDSASKSFRRKSLTAWEMAASLFRLPFRSICPITFCRGRPSARKAHTSPSDVHTVPSSNSAASQTRWPRAPIPPHELASTGTPADGGQACTGSSVEVALRRPAPGRWPSRSAGCGPSPGPSSRSNPGRRGPAASADPRRRAASVAATRQRAAPSRQPRARPGRLVLADDAAAFRRTRRSADASCRTACVPVSSS